MIEFLNQHLLFMKSLFSQGLLISSWIGVLILVNMSSIFFIKNHREARWALAAFIPNGIIMNILFNYYGYVKLLGITHVAFWTPLLIYFFRRRKNFELDTWFGKWAYGQMIINSISLIIDYWDVYLYFTQEK